MVAVLHHLDLDNTQDPATTLAEITAAARIHLPGVTLRRRLPFRCTLRWDKP